VPKPKTNPKRTKSGHEGELHRYYGNSKPIEGTSDLYLSTMLVRIYGFALNRKELPLDIPASKILEHLHENPNIGSSDTLRWITTTVDITKPESTNTQQWILGVLLKVRDSSRFTKVATRNGKLSITSEVLRDHENLIEANCFLMNPTKATGIYSHYRGAGSLQYDFQRVFQRALRKIQRAMKDEFDVESPLQKLPKDARKRLDGQVIADTILLSGDPKEFISRFKKISTASLKLVSEKITDDVFFGLNSKVKSQRLQVAFSDGAEPSQIAESIHNAIHEQHALSEATVQGIDENDFHRTMSFDKNPMVLSELDHSLVMSDFNLEEDTAASDMPKLAISKALIKVAKAGHIWPLLNPDE
jgi:hypothetical protein